MDPAVQMDPPYFAIKEAEQKIENENIKILFDMLYVEVFDDF